MDQRIVIQQQGQKIDNLTRSVTELRLLAHTLSTLVYRYQAGFKTLPPEIASRFEDLMKQTPTDIADQIIKLEINNTQLRKLVAQQQTNIDQLEAKIADHGPST